MFTEAGMRALHTWTHGCLDLLLEHARGLPPELFVRGIPGFGRGSVRDQFVHVIQNEAAWVHSMQDLPFTRWRPDDFPAPDSLIRAKREVSAATIAYLERLGETRLNETLDHQPVVWVGPLRSPAFILTHILTHTFHHKGQIVAMFRILGHPAPDTDLQR